MKMGILFFMATLILGWIFQALFLYGVPAGLPTPQWLLLAVLAPWLLRAQQPDPAESCTDLVYMKDGSVYRGKLIEHPLDGPLVLQTWSGLTVHLPAKKIRRVVQRCPDASLKIRATAPKPYSFKERGWYNATQLSYLAGNTWQGGAATGFSLHNSTGYSFNRWIGVGVGAGVDAYSPYLPFINQTTYPLFLETRGYLLAKNVSPFYNLSAGWGFAGGGTTDRPGYEDQWQGGWLAKALIGYRVGNHFSLFGGLRFQRQYRNWTSTWDQSYGQDRILHQRFELGFGLLL